MDRHIQYAMTSDGVSIAFTTAGSGPPILHPVPIAGGSLDFDELPRVFQEIYTRLAERYTVIRYDARGSGLSDREVGAFSMDGLVADMEAVVDRLKLDTFALFPASNMTPAAIAFAAKHPGRVSRLMTWCGVASGMDVQSAPRQAIESLASQDWRIYTETLGGVTFGWADAEDAKRLASLVRNSVTPAQRVAFQQAVREMDASELCAKVGIPALVMHMRGYPLVDARAAGRLAALLPDAQLTFFEGEGLLPPFSEVTRVLNAIDAFMGGPGDYEDREPDIHSHADVPAGALRTILFTDVEGSTALTQRLGDEGARHILRQHERITRRALAAFAGAEVKSLGDGFMAAFDSATRALECAVAMQQSFAAYNQLGGEQVRVRIGINAGEPISEGEDLFGTAVNLAARVAALAQGGQVLVSDVVRQLVAGKGFLFADRGEVLVRGFEDAVRLYELRWHPDEPAAAPREDRWRVSPA